MKTQAERCRTPLVKVHIERQKRLGERMIGESDKPRRLDLIVTAALLAAILAYGYINNYRLPWELLS